MLGKACPICHKASPASDSKDMELFGGSRGVGHGYNW